ncbi:polysaccharide biosynthesis protein [Dethiobacter alkaliphilus]|uniref:Polysaccharide biosynthesis protein CapD n=1 Tax=Dethiobacter alkaliphilus AHT 1 TaxID=555088 RepID=C0GGR3_DETAL|nr:nucleoside-diphosphate sugar epimerase/dehydratase [Dethiobacter alkaliphilus]EEG77504.1 polysaccharide biosynthesis protein CapD [Dethiobacter alkaliphilus AHT 1]
MDFKINRWQFILMIIDLHLVALSLYAALQLRFDFAIQQPYLALYFQQVIPLTILAIAIFYLLGLYRRLWQYASIGELALIVFSVSIAYIHIYLYTRFFVQPFPRSSYIIAWILSIALIGGTRFAIRFLRRTNNNCHSECETRVLIVGAGCAGTMVLKELQNHYYARLPKPVGFIDDDKAKERSIIHGVKVLGPRQDIPQIVETHNVDEIIIAMPSAPKDEVREIARICSKLPVKVSILPGVYEILSGDVSISKIRPVEIEDLLGRQEVKINLTEIASYLKKETVLVTGAGGSIGSELCRQITRFQPDTLILLDHTENSVYDIEMELQKRNLPCEIIPVVADIRDRKRIDLIFSTYNPTVIFHAAAHKHVPLMEANRTEAIKNNIFGTKNVAEAAHKYNAKSFLLISTDKAVNPTSVMGATKRIAEMVIQITSRKSNTRFCAVRFGNVLGSRGSVIPLFRKQIEAGGPVTVTSPEMTRYFMTIPEAVQLVIQAGAMGEKGEIFVLDMGEPVKITDLAHDLIRLSGFEPNKDIHISYTGIRPGEKLYEELLTNEEGNKTTKHTRIFIAKATDMTTIGFRQEMAHLSKILKEDLMSHNSHFTEIFQEKQWIKDTKVTHFPIKQLER